MNRAEQKSAKTNYGPCGDSTPEKVAYERIPKGQGCVASNLSGKRTELVFSAFAELLFVFTELLLQLLFFFFSTISVSNFF